MYRTARATCSSSMRGSTAISPFACGTPLTIPCVISVAALPMSIWPQAMSYLRPSSEVDLVKPVIACFVAVYGAEFGLGAWADMDPLLTIRPPRGSCFFIALIACCVQRKAPVRFTSTTDLHCSKVRSSRGTGGAPEPALLNRRSNRPNVSTVVSKRSLTDFGSLTSVGTPSIRAPSFDPSATTASKGSFRRPATTTEYPSPARARATALPMPVPPPVTTPTLVIEPMLIPPVFLRRERTRLRDSLTAGARPHRLLVSLCEQAGRRPLGRPSCGRGGDRPRPACS